MFITPRDNHLHNKVLPINISSKLFSVGSTTVVAALITALACAFYKGLLLIPLQFKGTCENKTSQSMGKVDMQVSKVLYFDTS